MAIASAVVGIGTALYSGYQQNKGQKAQEQASKDAMNAQINANREAAASQRRSQYAAKQGLGQFLLPSQRNAWGLDPLDTGGGQYGLDPLSQQRAMTGVLGGDAQQLFHNRFQEDPGTQYLRDEGLRDINQASSATGNLGGGSRLKAITEFSQNLANQQLNNRYNQLGGLAQNDLAMAGSMANMELGYGNTLAQNAQNMGQIQAGGMMNTANAQAASGNAIANNVAGIGGQVAGLIGNTDWSQFNSPQSPQSGVTPGGGTGMINNQPSYIANYGDTSTANYQPNQTGYGIGQSPASISGYGGVTPLSYTPQNSTVQIPPAGNTSSSFDGTWQ